MFEGFRNLFQIPNLGGSGMPIGFTTRAVGVPFLKTLTYGDFTGIATADQTVTSGKWNTVGYYTVSAQRFATWGQGSIALDPMNQGKVFLDAENTSGVDIDGVVRLVIANANETETKVVLEERTEKLSENSTDMTKWIRMSEYPIKAGEDSKLMIQFKPDTSGTLDCGETIIYIDITEYQ